MRVCTVCLSTWILAACAAEKGAPSEAGGEGADSGGTCTPTSELCNGVDDDCDGQVDEEATDAPSWYPDEDGDGHGRSDGAVAACAAPTATASVGDDCDDARAEVHPGAVERCTASGEEATDEDCDGLLDDDDEEVEGRIDWYADTDADGYGDESAVTSACAAPPDSTATGGDCDDEAPTRSPGAEETCGDGVDQDCDGGDTTCPRWSGEVEAEGAAAVTISGDRGSGFPRGLHVGDFTGDGVADLLAGAPDADVAGTDRTGEVYVLAGPLASGVARDLASLIVVRDDDHSSTRWADEITSVGDVDRDGVEDLHLLGLGVVWGGQTGELSMSEVGQDADGCSVTAPYVPAGTPTRNSFTCSLGSAAEGATLSLSSGEATFAGATGDDVGMALGAMDIDEDGIQDVLVSAPGMDIDGASSAGRIAGFLGPIASGFHTVYFPDMAIDAVDSGSGLGYYWIATGDFDGDGADDLATTAARDTARGATDGVTYIFFDPDAADLTTADADVALSGWTDSASTGDADGDGQPDLLLGNVAHSECELIYGPLPATASLPGGADARFQWTPAEGGEQCAFLPDTDADGDDELVIGSEANAGAIWILPGH